MAEISLFNRLFIEYIESLLIKHPEKEWDTETLFKNMPTFYQHTEMVNSAIHMLMMEKKIIQTRLDGRDIYVVNKSELDKTAATKQRDELNKQLDTKLKQLTNDNFFVPLNISRASVIVALASLAVSVSTLIYTIRQQGRQSKQLYKIEARISRDSSDSKIYLHYRDKDRD